MNAYLLILRQVQMHVLLSVRAVAKALFLKVPYFWASFDHILVLTVR